MVLSPPFVSFSAWIAMSVSHGAFPPLFLISILVKPVSPASIAHPNACELVSM